MHARDSLVIWPVLMNPSSQPYTIVYATYTIILIYQLCTPIMPPLLLVARLTPSGVKGKLNTYLLTLVTPLLPLQKQIMHAASSLGLYLST